MAQRTVFVCDGCGKDIVDTEVIRADNLAVGVFAEDGALVTAEYANKELCSEVCLKTEIGKSRQKSKDLLEEGA